MGSRKLLSFPGGSRRASIKWGQENLIRDDSDGKMIGDYRLGVHLVRRTITNLLTIAQLTAQILTTVSPRQMIVLNDGKVQM